MNSPVTSDQNSIQQVIFPPDRGGIGVLAVAPPFIAGHKPQVDGAMGVNIAMVNSDLDGLLVWILAYLNMAEGDFIEVFIGTTKVAEFPVTDAHFDDQGQAKNIPFHVPKQHMEDLFVSLQPRNADFWYKVTRISGNPDDSPRISLFYKKPAPGEPDTDGGMPFNQGLMFPVASESFVDQTVIDNGMFVTVLAYFNQSIGDVVVLAFGSLLLEMTVTALGDVVFELTPEMLAPLAPTNSLVVRWEVSDVVENYSGWSDALIIPFRPGMVLLAAPIFELADMDNVVNHDSLAGGAMNVLVTGVFAVNDLIELLLEGFTKSGVPVSHTYSRTLTGASRTQDFPVENEWVRNLIGGSLRATYKLIRAGKPQQSKPADVTIKGTSQPLGPPTVEPLVNNDTVPVDTAMAEVKLAEYWPLKTGANAEMWWQTTDPEGITVLFIFQLIVTDPKQPIIFNVPAKYISPYPGTPLAVQCKITNPGEAQVFSETLILRIGDEAKIELLPPKLVTPAVNPIDVFAHPNGVTVQVEYLAARDGDRARLVELNSSTDSPKFSLREFNQNKRVNTVLPATFLAARQGKEFALRWNLNRSNAYAGKSPELELTVLKIVDGDTRMPTPILAGVTVNELDVKKLQNGDQCHVAGWPFQALRQTVWLSYTGFNTLGQQITHKDLNGEPITSTQGLSRPAPIEWLKQLKDKTGLTITVKVNLAGKPDETSAVTFPIRTYLVKSTPVLSIDTRPMTLSGLSVKANWSGTGADSVGNTEIRVASGGQPPFLYTSDDSRIASVTSGGKVTGNSNDSTTIRVTDQNGTSRSYPVTVSNVFRLAINDNSMNYQQALNWMYSLPGASPVTRLALYDLIRVYGRMPIYKHYWLCEKGACQGISVGFAFFHHEYRAIYCADGRANYLGAWCLLRT